MSTPSTARRPDGTSGELFNVESSFCWPQQPQYEYVQQTTGADVQQDQTAQPQYQPAASGQFGVRGHQQQSGSEGDVSTAAKLIGVAYSPSNEVSQVKFSSAGLKYNF
uniref:Uncharacterized protein n=1 Tax=Anopheles culicifacies TaxID=139723 RepID=A0A182MWW5_9DIPT